MKTVYQVQFRSLFNEWSVFNHHNKYDVVDTIKEADKIMKRAKEWHKEIKLCNCEYRIIKITYNTEVIA